MCVSRKREGMLAEGGELFFIYIICLLHPTFEREQYAGSKSIYTIEEENDAK